MYLQTADEKIYFTGRDDITLVDLWMKFRKYQIIFCPE